MAIHGQDGDGEFSVSSARILIDDKTLGMAGSKTQLCKFVPLKVNIHSWRVKLNNLPMRLNLSRRDWRSWLSSLRLSPKLKMVLQGVFYITW
ncbi:hypothetical protein Tco_1532132 [Tanacetum coccineum]